MNQDNAHLIQAAHTLHQARVHYLSLLPGIPVEIAETTILSALVGEGVTITTPPLASTPHTTMSQEERIVLLLRANEGGLRSEQIRDNLKLHKELMPSLLKDLLSSNAIKKEGERRGTTYFASSGAVLPKAAPSRSAETVEKVPGRRVRTRYTGAEGGSYEEAIIGFLKQHPNSMSADINKVVQHPNSTNFSTILSSLRSKGTLDHDRARPAKWFVAGTKGAKAVTPTKERASRAPTSKKGDTKGNFLERESIQKILKAIDKLPEGPFTASDLAKKMKIPPSHLGFAFNGLRSHNILKSVGKGQWVRKGAAAKVEKTVVNVPESIASAPAAEATTN